MPRENETRLTLSVWSIVAIFAMVGAYTLALVWFT